MDGRCLVDETGGQLIIDGTSGDFPLVCPAWFPEDDGLIELIMGGDVEGDDTRIALGNYILNPVGYGQPRVLLDMWFIPGLDVNGDSYGTTPVEIETGFWSNIAYWQTEVVAPTVIARTATLYGPDGEPYSEGVMSRFRLGRRGKLRPSGWPITFEFTLPNGPFAAVTGS
jgi:hypothetical protein